MWAKCWSCCLPSVEFERRKWLVISQELKLLQVQGKGFFPSVQSVNNRPLFLHSVFRQIAQPGRFFFAAIPIHLQEPDVHLPGLQNDPQKNVILWHTRGGFLWLYFVSNSVELCLDLQEILVLENVYGLATFTIFALRFASDCRTELLEFWLAFLIKLHGQPF